MRRLARLVTVPAAAAVGMAAAAMRRRAGRVDWRDRVVLVVGASRGLGLAIARELVAQGARVVVAARDGGRLEAVAAELRAAGGDARAIPADIGDPAEARRLVDEAVAWHGRLDGLFNVAGVLAVAPAGTLEQSDFEEALDVMALGPIVTTLAALPALERSDAGRVANITSIGGKVPVPHLVPYATAKHAAVGFSESLRAELGPRGVRVTTVVPGLMATGSHLHAQVKGAHEREYRWFAALAQMPGLAMRADRAARRIVATTARGDAEASTTWWAPIAARVHGVAPGLVIRAISLVAPVLPQPRADMREPGEAHDEAHDEGDGDGDARRARERRPGHRIAAGIGPLSAREQRTVSRYGQEPKDGR